MKKEWRKFYEIDLKSFDSKVSEMVKYFTVKSLLTLTT